jgi:two-component system, sensor histidine kinase and response regulator
MPTILLVEDDLLSQIVLQDIFRYNKLPDELVCVGSAEEALRILPSLDPLLVLMDLMLPGMSGIEATKIIRLREQEERRPPVYIIAITANVMQDGRERCLAAGMDDYLSKPVRRNKLAEILRKCRPVDRPENDPATEAKGDSPHLPERPEGCCAQMGTVPLFPATVAREPVVEKPMIEEPLIS